MPRRSSTAKKPKPKPSYAALSKRVRTLQTLSASFYQMFGQANVPVRYLDAACAAGCGWPIKNTDLKPLTKAELRALGKEFGSRG